VAVDSAGNLYVATGDRVLKLAAGSSAQAVLPFTRIDAPQGGSSFGDVAVDAAGNLYVTDEGMNRVLKLAAS
jgi:serine/threonine-protein kinase